jgi:hypothetical protein
MPAGGVDLWAGDFVVSADLGWGWQVKFLLEWAVFVVRLG